MSAVIQMAKGKVVNLGTRDNVGSQKRFGEGPAKWRVG